MSKISDFASNSIMGVVRKIVNHIVDNVDPQISDVTDHLPARFSGTFNDNTRNLTMTIESQGASAENLVATVNIPAGGGGSGGPTYSPGNGINITSGNAIEIDTNVTATVAEVDTKVAKNQGTANAGKVLGIGSDGMVSPVDVGGSEWEKLDINNLPNDFSETDILKIKFKVGVQPKNATSWTSSVSANLINGAYAIIEIEIPNFDTLLNTPLTTYVQDSKGIGMAILNNMGSYSKWNNSSTSTVIFDIRMVAFNGHESSIDKLSVNKASLSSYVEWIYRKKV